MTSIFEGLRVVDLSKGMAGAVATMVMADNGAEVIKVEPPEGDPGRAEPAFRQWHRGKQSVVLDLGTPEGRARAHQLALSADVLVENFRPAVADRFGFGYASLSAVNCGLVQCSIT